MTDLNALYLLLSIMAIITGGILYVIGKIHCLDKYKVSYDTFEKELDKVSKQAADKFADRSAIEVINYKISNIESILNDIKGNMNAVMQSLMAINSEDFSKKLKHHARKYELENKHD